MFAFIFNFILMFAGDAPVESGFSHFWHTYFNYPGFEAWKFLNLGIFVALAVYFLRAPLSDAFKARREVIRAELIKAEAEKQAALARQTEAEAKLARLKTEEENVRRRAAEDAVAEKSRVIEQTETDIRKLREQAKNEIERASLQAKFELRKFSAEESVRLAEEKIKTAMNPATDARLVEVSIESIGGLR